MCLHHRNGCSQRASRAKVGLDPPRTAKLGYVVNEKST